MRWDSICPARRAARCCSNSTRSCATCWSTIHRPSPFTATMKLEFTWPSGFRSAICSGCGSVAGASALAAARFPAQVDAVETCAGAAAVPNALPAPKGIRCSTGCIGAFERPNPPSEPTPEPSPMSSIGGITGRGTANPAGAGVIPPESAPFPKPAAACGAGLVAAAAAKLAMGRALISACRIVSRVKSCTNCERRKRTSIFAGCTLTSTSSYGILRNSSVAGKTVGGKMLR